MKSHLLAVMFTDIADYTELTRRLNHARLQALLSRHDRIIREQTGCRHGRIVKSIGDSFLIVFTSVTDALHAALGIQRALDEHNRLVPLSEKMALKIAIHAGEVNVNHSGDVLGDPVNVCSRIQKVASGGEVLFSGVVCQSVNLVGFEYQEFGLERFKGVGAPVRLYRLLTVREHSGVAERAALVGDIIAFGRLVERDSKSAEWILAECDKLLVPRVKRLGGIVQNVFGDMFLATFEDLSLAAQCAVDFVTAVRKLKRPISGRWKPQVCCGLHWGPVHFVRGRPFGNTVNLASRLQGHRRGNHVNVSATVRNKLAGNPAFQFRNLGQLPPGPGAPMVPMFRLTQRNGRLPR